jgi:cytochrome c biogenesis protein CcmG, thiol:disulfide interchange protein DsbE
MREDVKSSVMSSKAASPKAWWAYLFRAAVVLVLLGFLAVVGWRLSTVKLGPRATGPAPDFSLTGFDGQVVTLSKLRGQVVVINFWASWCQPCRQEAAYLERTWRKYENKGVVFIGVDWSDTEKDARAYIKEFDLTYLTGPDLGTRISQSFRIQGVPETYYVDKTGQLRGVTIGPLETPVLDNKIDALLREP